TFNDELREMRKEVRRAFVSRTERSIRRLQDEGVADPGLDAYHTANALGAMVDRFAYIWFVLGESFDFETALKTLSHLWAAGLGIESTPSPARTRPPKSPSE